MRFLPVLFYASILLIVGLWLRPLLRDLRVLTVASQKFATDYREPLDTASRTTQLTSLATNLDDMSAQGEPAHPVAEGNDRRAVA